MIEIKQLNKSYDNGIVALHDINLHIAKGSICGVIGKSGAGKSSLLRCVNRLEQPSSGHITIDGQDISQLSGSALREMRSHISMIFQHFNLLSSRNVFENAALPLQLSGHKPADITNKVRQLLDLVDLSDKLEAYPSQLSGGQKQRVAIARALANDPKLLLCDEATSALDPQTTQSILKLLQTINQQLNLTILLITHEIDVVKQICDQVVILDQGRIIEQGDVKTVFSQAKTQIAKDLLHNALHAQLSDSLLDSLVIKPTNGKHPVLRIDFSGDITKKPLITQLVEKFQLECNILQANTEIIGGETFGAIFIETLGEQQCIDAGIAYLQQHNLRVEVIGYVNT